MGAGQRAILALGLIVGAGLAEVAAAAALPVSVAGLGAGTASVPRCDSNGFTFAASIDTSSRITGVTVTGIDAGCAGGTLRVTLANGTASVGSGTTSLPSSGFGGSASVSVSPTPLSSGVDRILAAIEVQ